MVSIRVNLPAAQRNVAHSVAQRAAQTLYIGIERDIASYVTKAALRADVSVHKLLVSWLQAVELNLFNPEDVARTNAELAAMMRDSVKRSYDQTVTARKGVESYRIGQNRYAGGALRRALENPEMAVGNAQGIFFVNQSILDSEARHWRRLNFGAYGTGVSGRHVQDFRIMFDGIQIMNLKFSSQPRPAFAVPPGVWISKEGFLSGGDAYVKASADRRGMDKFYPGGRGQFGGSKTSRGIEARNFLDAGLARLQAEFPAAYRAMLTKWAAKSKGAVEVPPVVVA